jgi:hypothetical protein
MVSSTEREGMADNAEKVRENRLRAAAKRQGLELSKSRSRDPRAIDYGRWLVIDAGSGMVVGGGAGGRHDMDLDQVEAYLKGEEQ